MLLRFCAVIGTNIFLWPCSPTILLVRSATDRTPFKLVYGRKSCALTEFLDYSRIRTYSDYLVELYNHLNDIRQVAADNLIQAKIDSKKCFDRHLNAVEHKK